LLEVREYQATLGAGGRRLRIAVVGDFHLGYYRHRDWVEKIVIKINAADPDVVVLTGDFVSNAAGLDGLAPLKDLRSRFGSFAVLGNHDYRIGAVDVRRAIEGYNVEVLTNESVALDLGGQAVRLIGLDDLTYGRPLWMSALEDVAPDDVTILAVHNPDAAREAEVRGLDLVLAGHTHCGQVRLPFVGPVPQLPTTLGREFDCGLFTFGPTQLFITRGVGETGARARLFNRPEISVVDVAL
jgi:predicted MPP superfamily phosphohydrolase